MKTSLQFGYSLVTYKKRPDRIFTIGTYSLFGFVFPCSNLYYFVIDVFFYRIAVKNMSFKINAFYIFHTYRRFCIQCNFNLICFNGSVFISKQLHIRILNSTGISRFAGKLYFSTVGNVTQLVFINKFQC